MDVCLLLFVSYRFDRGFGDIFSSVCMLSVMIVWTPTENAEKYQTHIQLATEEGGVVGEEDPVLGLMENEEVNTLVEEVPTTGFQSMSFQ